MYQKRRPPLILETIEDRGQKDMVTYVIEVTDLNSEVISDLRGHLEAAMASDATKMQYVLPYKQFLLCTLLI